MKKLSWEDIENITDELANKIKASGFRPDYIIGVTTGGLIPLYFLVKKLDIDNILTVSASSYEKDKQKELKITYLPEVNLKGKNLLLIDEITETGVSLKGVSDAIISKYQPNELKTATLGVNKDKCKFYPDFYVVIEEGEWIVFPWEKEDFPEYFSE
ncbi:MAG: phosphoribosyltransferase family protein [Candidatus Spechtbacterales bacterium]